MSWNSPEFKIGFLFSKRKASERRNRIAALGCIRLVVLRMSLLDNACLASRPTHDFKNRIAVELVA